MKKLLLSIAAVMFAVFGVAADVVIDFTDEEANTSAQATVDGVELTLQPLNTARINKGYLMLESKKGTCSASFTLQEPFTTMVLTNTGACSMSATLNVYVNDELVAENLALTKQGSDYTIQLQGKGVSGATYKIESANTKYNAQITKITMVSPTQEVALNVDNSNLSFAAGLGYSQQKSVQVLASNLTEDITVTYSNGAFSGATTLEKDATSFDIDFSAMAAGDYEGVVTLKSGDKEVEIAVKGYMANNTGDDDDPLSVSDVIKMNCVNAGPFYVTGEVAGYTAATAVDGVLQQAATAMNSNIVLVEGEDAISVVLPSGAIRDALNIVDNPGNIGKKAIVAGTLELYYGAAGVKNTSYGEIVADAVEEVALPVMMINEVEVTAEEGEDEWGDPAMVAKYAASEAVVVTFKNLDNGLDLSVSVIYEDGTDNMMTEYDYTPVKIEKSAKVKAFYYNLDTDVWGKQLIVDITVDTTTVGVESISASEDAVYFDLCGNRVNLNEASKGVFVKVAAGKAVKVVK